MRKKRGSAETRRGFEGCPYGRPIKGDCPYNGRYKKESSYEELN